MKFSHPDKILYSWAFYDFANTIFSAIVLTAYFPLYLTEISGQNRPLGLATFSAMILAGLAVPFLGILSDQTGKTKTYLYRTTLITVFLFSLLSFFKSPAVLIFLFILACFFYHASLVFYNALLVVAAPPAKQGMASGLGTGLGYLGVLMILPVTHWIDGQFGRSYVFLAGAAGFLIFSCPLFLWVPERHVPHPVKFEFRLFSGEIRKLKQTLKKLPAKPALLLFLGGNFFVVDALNSMIFWFMIYAKEVFQPEHGTLILILAAVNCAAFLWGIITGYLTDLWSGLKTMIFSAFMLVLSLLLLVFSSNLFWFMISALGGGALAIAGIWTSGRKALLEFIADHEAGEYFGLYGLTTKISVIGSLAFSVTADLAGFRQALGVLIFPALAGLLMLVFAQRLSKA